MSNSQEFSIRTATANDLHKVGTLLMASYSVLMKGAYQGALLERALPLIAVANPDLLSCGTYYVAETRDGEIVGCGGWTIQQPGTGAQQEGTAHIRHFAVHPERTGQGIGRALFNRCAEEARKAGAEYFECFSSLNAEDFYAALGFKIVKRVDIPLAEQLIFPATLMLCPLSSIAE